MSDLFKLVFLGTGASAPSKHRGLPSLAIVRENNIILCDCGEGTQLQLLKAGLAPSKISTICISHLHGDHIFGLAGFLTTQQLNSRVAPLTILGPNGIRKFINCIKDISKYEIDYPLHIIEISKNFARSTTNKFTIETKVLEHSSPCLGYRFIEDSKPGKFDQNKAEHLGIPHGPMRKELLKGKSVQLDQRTVYPFEVCEQPIPGRVITYCTDTKPCKNAIDLARDSDILIHDATFSEKYADRAEPTFHSTSKNAALIAAQAKTRKLILWHISIRVQGDEENKLLLEAQNIFAESYLPEDLEEMIVQRHFTKDNKNE